MSKKYKDENDYELNYLVSENSEEAKELFFKKYKPIIEMKARKFKEYVENRGYDYNDLIQEGMMGLSEAIKDYSSQKNTQFKSFANLCIDRQLSTFIRNIDREKHKILNNSVSIDMNIDSLGKPLIELLDNKNIDPETAFVQVEEQSELYNQVKEVLTDSENEVFDLRVQGFSHKEIASLLNISEKSVAGRIQRIRKKVSKIMEERNK
ncbi:MAG: sigma-70 family RNA polymerase sigma factor [Bacilli bacterium]|nr:sigma-70 family RNA polymerase sigma factor [Bacilli bacterium]